MPPKENPSLEVIKSIQDVIKKVEKSVEGIVLGLLPKDFLLDDNKNNIVKNGVKMSKHGCEVLHKIYNKLKRNHFIVANGEFLSQIQAENIKFLFTDNGNTQNKNIIEKLNSVIASDREYFSKIAQKWDIKQVNTLNEISEIFSNEQEFKFEQNYNYKDRNLNSTTNNNFKEIWAFLQVHLINLIHILKDLDTDLINENDLSQKEKEKRVKDKISVLLNIKDEFNNFILKNNMQNFLELAGFDKSRDSEFFRYMLNFLNLIKYDLSENILEDFSNFEKLIIGFKGFYSQIKYIQKNICNENQK